MPVVHGSDSWSALICMPRLGKASVEKGLEFQPPGAWGKQPTGRATLYGDHAASDHFGHGVRMFRGKHSNLETQCQPRGRPERDSNSGHARRPSKTVEDLTQNDTANESAEEIARQVDATR